MVANNIQTIVQDEKVFVSVEDLLEALFGVCNQWKLLYTGPDQIEAVHRLMGMIDMCQGLEEVHDIWKRRAGLT